MCRLWFLATEIVRSNEIDLRCCLKVASSCRPQTPAALKTTNRTVAIKILVWTKPPTYVHIYIHTYECIWKFKHHWPSMNCYGTENKQKTKKKKTKPPNRIPMKHNMQMITAKIFLVVFFFYLEFSLMWNELLLRSTFSFNKYLNCLMNICYLCNILINAKYSTTVHVFEEEYKRMMEITWTKAFGCLVSLKY